MINEIRKFIKKKNLDGYIIPKNDKFFTEYSNINNLAEATKFTGSAGFALLTKSRNYLFVDGRYTIQAKSQSGKNFEIIEIPYTWPKNIVNISNYKIGFDPKLFTKITLEKYFDNKFKLIPINFNFKNKIKKKLKKAFRLENSISGESSFSKLNKIKKFMKLKKINYLYCSASENVNWLLNIRGKDLPNSPLVNCKLIISDNGKLYLFVNPKKISGLLKKKLKSLIICK